MTRTFEATFDGEVFRPTEAVDLKPDTRVQLTFTINPASEEKSKSFLRVARSLDLAGPADWSLRLNDYLYGDAKPGDE